MPSTYYWHKSKLCNIFGVSIKFIISNIRFELKSQPLVYHYNLDILVRNSDFSNKFCIWYNFCYFLHLKENKLEPLKACCPLRGHFGLWAGFDDLNF